MTAKSAEANCRYTEQLLIRSNFLSGDDSSVTENKQHISWIRPLGKVRDFLIIMIRHKLPFLYRFLDLVNNIYGQIFFRSFKRSLSQYAWEGLKPSDMVEILTEKDIPRLLALIRSASEESKRFFKPHAIAENTFSRLMRAPYYLAVGYKVSGDIVGYAFLHLYFPGKAFAGYFVTDANQGKGIGKHLFKILNDITNKTKFPLYTYVKEENLASIRVSSDFIVEQRVPGGYLMIQHTRNNEP
jgi:hypothetical protein